MINGITGSMDMSLSKFWELVKDREAWRAAVHRVVKSQTQPSDWTELNYDGTDDMNSIKNLNAHLLSSSVLLFPSLTSPEPVWTPSTFKNPQFPRSTKLCAPTLLSEP